MLGRVGNSQSNLVPHTIRKRIEWNNELCNDLYQCYNLSDPGKTKYMERLHELWKELHPELSHLTAQNLRDQVSALKKRGFKPASIANVTNEELQLQQDEPESQIDMELEQKFLENLRKYAGKERQRNIHSKQNVRSGKISSMNRIMDKHLSEAANLWEIDQIVYAAAATLSTNMAKNEKIPKLKERIKKLSLKITTWRRRASQAQSLMDYMLQRRRFTQKISKIAQEIKNRHHKLNRNVLVLVKEQAVDKVRALVAAKRKVEQSLKRIEHNYKFMQKPSQLFQENNTFNNNSKLNLIEVEAYWRQLYENEVHIDENSHYLTLFERYCTNKVHRTQPMPVTSETIKQATTSKRNFSSPGPDAINAYWWKRFYVTHKHLTRAFNEIMEGNIETPAWLSEGRTILIYKKGDNKNPSNYRPITCLNVVYKIFTTILYERVLRSAQPIWTNINEQRGAKRGTAGLKENLLIDTTVCQDSRTYKRNLSMAWIDYRKAFDCTSHRLVLRLLGALGVDLNTITTVRNLMSNWKTRVILGSGRKIVTSNQITYKRGIFQGDSLSPILFCISLLPLSLQLRKCNGYLVGPPGNRKHKVTHLFYVDDLKMYAQNENELKKMINITHEYSDKIGMEMGYEKCSIYHLKKGRPTENEADVELVDGAIIRHLAPDEHYTYLGIPQSYLNNTQQIKNNLRTKYLECVKKVWNTQLSAKNKCLATNTLAVPIVSYTFGAIKWNIDDIRDLDRKTRKTIINARSLHPNASIQRLYLQRNQGGRGIRRIEDVFNQANIMTAVNIYNSEDPLLRMVKEHELIGKACFLFKAAERAAEAYELDLKISTRGARGLAKLTNREIESELKSAINESLKKSHMNKNLHSQYYRCMESQNLSKELTFSFLRSDRLFSETEGFIMACQDGVYASLKYRQEVLRCELENVNCRACKASPETTMHLLSACPRYARTIYIQRHDNALKVFYLHLRYKYAIDKNPLAPYQLTDIPAMVSNDVVKIYWNFSFATTAQVSANKPDMVVMLQKEKKIFVVEMSCPAERNITDKETEKHQKYMDLIYQMSKTYPNYKIQFIPVIVGVLGGIRPQLLDHLRKMAISVAQGKRLISEIQKYVILGSLKVLRSHESGHPT